MWTPKHTSRNWDIGGKKSKYEQIFPHLFELIFASWLDSFSSVIVKQNKKCFKGEVVMPVQLWPYFTLHLSYSPVIAGALDGAF